MRDKNSCHTKALRITSTLLLSSAALSASAVETADYAPTPQSAVAAPPDWNAAIDAARAEVAAARARSNAAPLDLARALTTLGDAHLRGGDYESGQAAYSEALKLTERQLGENNARTLAPLRGLGFALAGSGEHDAAIPYLERSLHITQASFGLFDLRQQDLLRQLAFSLTATWRGADAQKYMIYRLRVAEKTYGEGDPRVLPAFCDAGDWFLDIAKFEEARSAFQVALNIVDQRFDEHDLAAVAPLRGMASTYMREQSYRAFAMALKGPPYHTEFDARGAAVRPTGPRRLNAYGERLLQRALRLLDDDPQAPRQALIDTLIQLGDWFQIKHSPAEALPYYQRAWRLIAEQPEENAVFGFPVRVYYPAPLIVFQNLMLPADEVEVHRVHMRFTVTADGAVADARLVEHDTSRNYAADILDALRAARFRPKLVDGQPVSTPALDYTEVFRMTPQKLTSNSRRSANP